MRAITLASIFGVLVAVAVAVLDPRAAQAVSCDTFDPCMINGMCQGNGECTGSPAPNDTMCDDGNPCTKNDSCQAGVCKGIADTEKNGQPCDIGLGKCAINPTCTVISVPGFDFAICTPESFVECDETDSDQCTVNACNPDTGACQIFTNPCFGECGSCNPTTGQCTANPKPNGSTCDDFNTCTANDGCQAGSCVGGGGSGGPTPTRTPTIAGGVATATRTSTITPTRTATITSTRTATRTSTPTSTPTGGTAACFGDCNGSGTLTASDIGRINSTLLRCGPCAGNVPGGIASGCATLAGGCPPADFNTDGCLRASELARANQNILKYQPSGCAPPAP